MGQEGRFSKLDMSAAELSSELNLAFGDSVGTTPTPPPTCQVLPKTKAVTNIFLLLFQAFSTPTPPPNCPPPPPPQLNNQALLDLPPSEERVGEVRSQLNFVMSELFLEFLARVSGIFRPNFLVSHFSGLFQLIFFEVYLLCDVIPCSVRT